MPLPSEGARCLGFLYKERCDCEQRLLNGGLDAGLSSENLLL